MSNTVKLSDSVHVMVHEDFPLGYGFMSDHDGATIRGFPVEYQNWIFSESFVPNGRLHRGTVKLGTLTITAKSFVWNSMI